MNEESIRILEDWDRKCCSLLNALGGAMQDVSDIQHGAMQDVSDIQQAASRMAEDLKLADAFRRAQEDNAKEKDT